MSEIREPKVVEIDEIMQLLPHRYPFLMVDRVIDFEKAPLKCEIM